MKAQPAITVVIPLYNKEAEVARAVRSVLSQTFRDFQLLVVDDGSTDDGPDIVRRISDPRITILRQTNQGVSAARNAGVAAARASLVAFLDADDEWQPGFLRAILDLVAAHAAGIYATAYTIARSDGATFAPAIRRAGLRYPGIIEDFFATSLGLLSCSSVAIPRHTFLQVGGFRIGLPIGEDFDLWLRIAARHSVAYCPVAMAIWHHNSQNRASDRHASPPVSPAYDSLLALLRDGGVAWRTKRRMIRWVARYEISNILWSFVRQPRPIGAWRQLRLWERRFGSCWRLAHAYLVLRLPLLWRQKLLRSEKLCGS